MPAGVVVLRTCGVSGIDTPCRVCSFPMPTFLALTIPPSLTSTYANSCIVVCIMSMETLPHSSLLLPAVSELCYVFKGIGHCATSSSSATKLAGHLLADAHCRSASHLLCDDHLKPLDHCLTHRCPDFTAGGAVAICGRICTRNHSVFVGVWI